MYFKEKKIVDIVWPVDPDTKREVDLERLSPMARALAEAICSGDRRWVSVRSVGTLLETLSPHQRATAGQWYNAEQLAAPCTMTWEGWAAVPPGGGLMSPAQMLEYEAKKLLKGGWYPVASGGDDLPSSPAARKAAQMHSGQHG